MQIRNLVKRLFTSLEVQTLAEKILHAIQPLKETQPIIAALSDSLYKALNLLKAARKNTAHNTHTQQLADADDKRDMAYRAFLLFIEALSIRQNEALSTPAKSLQKHIEKFDKRIPYLGYSAQTAEMNLFFAEMKKAKALVDAAGATEWLDEVIGAQEHFLTVQGDRADEEVEKNLLKPAKEAKEATFQQLVGIVNILNGIAISGTTDLQDVNAKIDQIIADAEGIARARQTRNENKSSKDDKATE